jgi:pimeloyl-ACP methyl ester carboxylesterase
MIACINIEGARIAFCVEGRADAPPLLLLNSLGTDWRMWEPQVAALGVRFRLIRCDFRGHGRSETGSAPLDLARLGEDALAVCDALGVAQAHVCGLSLGGLVAQWLAIHRPERIQRLVLANTAARIGSAEGWQARIDAVQRGGMESIRELVLARFLSVENRTENRELRTRNLGTWEPGNREPRTENREPRTENLGTENLGTENLGTWEPRDREPRTKNQEPRTENQEPPAALSRPVDLVNAMLDDVDPEGYIAACAALRDADLSANVAQIRAPTLVIGGEIDEATSPAQAVQLHNAIAGSSLAIIQQAAHLSNLKQPETFNAVVRSFLERSIE